MTAALVRISVLGSLEVHRAGTLVQVRGVRSRTALAALVTSAPRPISAAGMATALWGTDLPDWPRGAVQTVVSRLRSAVGPGVIDSSAAGYRLSIPADSVDARRFSDLVREAGNQPPAMAADSLDRALELWRGPAFADFVDLDAAEEIRFGAARLEELRLQAMEHRAEIALGLNDAVTAIAIMERVVAEQSLRESAVGLLMRARYRAGQAPAALHAYRTYRERLVAEMGLEPAPELGKLQLQILGHEVPTARPEPPATAEDGDPTAIGTGGSPAWQPDPDHFFGRGEEMDRLIRLVEDHRLVSITGPGGVGKSRLTAEALPRLTERLGRSAVIVELEQVAPDGVDERLAAALRLRDTTQPWIAVVDYLAAAPQVLVLDAAEGARDVLSGRIAELLHRVPGARVVVTSRRRLGLGVERVLPLHPLPSPVPGENPDQTLATPAGQLVVAKLRRHQPDHPVTREMLHEIAEICRLLDGLPLALELAAAQAAVLGTHTVLAALRTSNQLPGEPEEILRTVVARSQEQLAFTDRLLLGRLAVFRGVFTLADARHMDSAAMAGLPRLVAASLVEAVAEGRERTFRILGVIRARTVAEDSQDLQRRFWQWAVETTESCARAVLGRDGALALRRLDHAAEDLSAAVQQALEAGQLSTAASIVGQLGLCVHWIPRAGLAENTLRVGEHPDLTGRPEEALARAASAVVAAERGELDRAEQLSEIAAAVASAPEERFLAGVGSGIAAVYAGDWENGIRRWRNVLDTEGLEAAQLSDAHAVLALLHTVHWPGEAGEHAALARRLAADSQAPARVAFALYSSGEVLLTTDMSAAIDVLRVAVRMADSAGAAQVATVSRVALLSALTRTGQVAEAGALSLTLLDLQLRRGYRAQLWNTMRILAELFAVAGNPEMAALILAAAAAADTAPVPAGADIERYRLLHQRLREQLGGQRADSVAAVASVLPPAEILRRVREAATDLADYPPGK